MKQIILILLFNLLFSSCARIYNEPTKKVRIYTTEPSKIVVKTDTFITKKNRIKIDVPRGKYTLNLTVLTDSLKKTVSVKPFNSFNYYLNIVQNFGIGMLIDRNHPKRYGFPTRIYLNSADILNKYFGYSQAKNNGALFFNLSMPHINNFKLKPQNEPLKDNTGFWGFSVGMDYFYANNRFINLSASVHTNLFTPVPAAVDYFDDYEVMNSKSLSLSHNHRIKRFTLGYGIAYCENSWLFNDYDSTGYKESIFKKNNALGLVFKSYFQTANNSYIGLIYRPTFIRFMERNKYEYEHLISIDFITKIRLKK
jgi:hypothetical protein